MSYSYQYGCGDDEPLHICHDCPGGRDPEYGRVQRSGFVKEAYYATIKADPTALAAWQAGVAAGMVIVIPETTGSYDPGDPKEGKGFGKRPFTYGLRTMTLSIGDPDYFDNYHFYNEISERTDLIPFFVTSSILHLFDKPASIKAKDPVTEELDDEVYWQVECQVKSKNIPSKHRVAAIESIFECSTF